MRFCSKISATLLVAVLLTTGVVGQNANPSPSASGAGNTSPSPSGGGNATPSSSAGGNSTPTGTPSGSTAANPSGTNTPTPSGAAGNNTTTPATPDGNNTTTPNSNTCTGFPNPSNPVLTLCSPAKIWDNALNTQGRYLISNTDEVKFQWVLQKVTVLPQVLTFRLTVPSVTNKAFVANVSGSETVYIWKTKDWDQTSYPLKEGSGYVMEITDADAEAANANTTGRMTRTSFSFSIYTKIGNKPVDPNSLNAAPSQTPTIAFVTMLLSSFLILGQ
ncbi:hypothetical protein K7432_006434 [Basidiobolus ranarum]|uniref:DUF7137 domain-containing protein n=1 Tax=Basidiobolus ranarum TaxID=34480 RepID=A0ABR2WUY8_9FUNG